MSVSIRTILYNTMRGEENEDYPSQPRRWILIPGSDVATLEHRLIDNFSSRVNELLIPGEFVEQWYVISKQVRDSGNGYLVDKVSFQETLNSLAPIHIEVHVSAVVKQLDQLQYISSDNFCFPCQILGNNIEGITQNKYRLVIRP